MSLISRPASATAFAHASTVNDSGSTMSRRPIGERPIPDSTDRCSNRSSLTGGVGIGDRCSAIGSAAAISPVGSNKGSQTSSCRSKRTTTSWPTRTSSGSMPTMLVVSRTAASSARATTATT